MWVPCFCGGCSGQVLLRSSGQGPQPRYCLHCRRRRAVAVSRAYDAAHPDTEPRGKKRGVCSSCGKPVWLGTGSREAPTCRDCRRVAGPPRYFVYGQATAVCKQCGNAFPIGNKRSRVPKFCSKKCRDDAMRLYADPRHASRVSARKRRTIHVATWDGVTDNQIWERDGWVCLLGERCLFPGEPLDRTSLPKGVRPSRTRNPLYPTVDHIVPLSRGGPDTAVNKRAAHLACNCSRGARMTADEEALAIRMLPDDLR